MALDRKYQKIFGKNAETTDLGIVGSKNAGNPDNSTDVEELQSLSNWETGLRAQVTASEAPYLQDQNSIFYVITSQLAYLFQAGIAEWQVDTEYISGRSVVLKNGKIYLAIANSTGVEPEVTTNWDTKWIGLTDWLVKGVTFNSGYSSAFSGYSFGDRVLYTNEKGSKFYVESLINGNTSQPSNSNVYIIEDLKEAEGFVASISPDLPTPSASTLGQIYLVIGIVSTEKPSCANVWICQEQNQTYNWVQKSIESVFDDNDTVFVKAGNNNGVYYAKGGEAIAFNQIGYDNLSSYKWIYIPESPKHNEIFVKGITKYALEHLVTGTKETVYQTTKPTVVIFGALSMQTNKSWFLDVSTDGVNFKTIAGAKFQISSEIMQSIILDKDVYWQVRTDISSTSDYRIEYSSLY